MVSIERATIEDAEELLEIYAPYVTSTAVSFEYEVPSIEEFRERIRSISSKYPYLKVVKDGKIMGYAYANSFKGRKAYDYSIETTIYLRSDAKGQGLGKQLYSALEKALISMNILNMNACIAVPKDANDPYLTNGSILFHEKMGFSLVGTFTNSGYKFDRWYDMLWMEKLLGQHTSPAPEVKFGEYTL